jgi:signal transduction histidine kinase
MRASNLVREITGVAESAEGSLPARIDLQLQVPTNPVFVPGDLVQIRQVLLNLVVNAIESIAESGTVSVPLLEEVNIAV